MVSVGLGSRGSATATAAQDESSAVISGLWGRGHSLGPSVKEQLTPSATGNQGCAFHNDSREVAEQGLQHRPAPHRVPVCFLGVPTPFPQSYPGEGLSLLAAADSQSWVGWPVQKAPGAAPGATGLGILTGISLNVGPSAQVTWACQL